MASIRLSLIHIYLPDAGIFRPVSLLGINTARIDSVYIKQTHEPVSYTHLDVYKRQLYDDDLAIIITADHGEDLGEFGIYGEHGLSLIHI